MPVLEAADRKAVCPVVIVHVRIGAVEVQVVSVIASRYTAPIVAVAIHIVERGIAVVPVARQRK